MAAFYLAMDTAVLHREGPRVATYHPNRRFEFSLEELQRGRRYLDAASKRVASDARLSRRVDLARFAHAILTLVRIRNDSKPSPMARSLAEQAVGEAIALQARYTLLVRKPTRSFLSPPKRSD